MNATRNSNDATGNANKQDTLMDAASLPIEVLRLGGDTLSTTQKELLETDPSVFQCLLNYRIEERVPGKRRSSAVETFCLRELLQGFAKLPLREGPPVPVSHVSLGVRIANLIVKFLEDENYLSLLLLRLQAAATACSADDSQHLQREWIRLFALPDCANLLSLSEEFLKPMYLGFYGATQTNYSPGSGVVAMSFGQQQYDSPPRDDYGDILPLLASFASDDLKAAATTVSQNLTILKSASLVASRELGRFVLNGESFRKNSKKDTLKNHFVTFTSYLRANNYPVSSIAGAGRVPLENSHENSHASAAAAAAGPESAALPTGTGVSPPAPATKKGRTRGGPVESDNPLHCPALGVICHNSDPDDRPTCLCVDCKKLCHFQCRSRDTHKCWHCSVRRPLKKRKEPKKRNKTLADLPSNAVYFSCTNPNCDWVTHFRIQESGEQKTLDKLKLEGPDHKGRRRIDSCSSQCAANCLKPPKWRLVNHRDYKSARKHYYSCTMKQNPGRYQSSKEIPDTDIPLIFQDKRKKPGVTLPEGWATFSDEQKRQFYHDLNKKTIKRLKSIVANTYDEMQAGRRITHWSREDLLFCFRMGDLRSDEI